MKLCRSECGPIRLVMPAFLGQAADHPGGRVTSETLAVVAEEDRPLEPLSHRQIERSGRPRCQRDGDGLAALAVHHQGAVPALQAELSMSAPSASEIPSPFNASSEHRAWSCGEARPACTSKAPSSLRSRPTAGLVVDLRATDVYGRGVLDDSLFGGVPVEAGECGETAADGGRRTAEFLELSCVQLDVSSGDVEETNAVLVAPLHELPDIQRVRLPSSAGVAGQEPRSGRDPW